jgi:hypothetical protein
MSLSAVSPLHVGSLRLHRSQYRLLELSRQHELTNVSVVDGMLEVEDWNAKTRGKGEEAPSV